MPPSSAAQSAVEGVIRSAFAGVTLGRGISIRQSERMDDPDAICAGRDFEALPRGEVTDDWTKIPDAELERICTGYLDAEGFRYYVPALALGVLRRFDGGALWVIGTLSCLCPQAENREFLARMHALLDARQNRALALFMQQLPDLVTLDYEHAKRVPRAVQNYWRRFLEPGS